jgi:OOP family OmpA-OmpF porin
LPPSLAVPLALLLLGLLLWGWLNWRDHRRWNAYLTRLQSEPGILVTEQQSRYGLLGSRFTLSGLRDPLAPDPAKLLREQTPLNPARVASHWQGYYALDAQMVTARAAQVLEPPNSVKLETRDGVLYASGSATRAWIETARRLTRALPGVLRFDTQQLLDADQERLLVMQRELEKNRLQFATGTARLIPGQEAELQKMALRLKDAVALADYTKRPLTIEVIGQTDPTGTEEINKPLRLARAQSILAQLAARSIPRNNLTASAGLPPTQNAAASAEELQRNRAVTFKITLADPQ